MKSIYDLTIHELEDFFISINEKKFKAIQLFEWLYIKRINTYEEITNIKKEIINQVKNQYGLNKLQIVTKKQSEDTIKYLFELEDKSKIEAVLMKHNYGNSLCLSTQVGCNMGCSFCESGRLKKVRNLKPSEMILPILQIEQETNIRISHIVLMGIGEPFDNYDNVIKFIDIINHPKSLSIGSRHITISTCGIIPKIDMFSNYDKQVNLAISLHAPNNTIRNELMPINKVYQIEPLINSIKNYIKKTNRRITFEYIMLKDINDSLDNAIQLCQLLKGINCYVNIIPYNETSNIKYKKSNKKTILDFYDILKKNKINVTIRKEFGSELNAACGQLRANYEEEK